MTAVYDEYVKTLAHTKVIYRDPNGIEIAMPEVIKPAVLDIVRQETSNGTSELVLGCHNERGNFGPTYNFYSLQYRNDILVDFPIGKISYKGPDGWRDYCSFRNILEAIIGFWAFIHRYPYPKIDLHLSDPNDFINYLIPIFCQYGHSEEFKAATGGKTYAQMCNEVYRQDSIAELKKYRYDTIDISPAVNAIKNYIIRHRKTPPEIHYIKNGVIYGPNVKYFWVSNFTKGRTKKIEGVIYHEPDARGTGKELIGQGIINDWSNKLAWKSANVLFLEDGIILQTVNLNDTAWHCGFNNGYYNPRTIGLEFAYLGPFWPSREILGWFYRWKGLLWEQSIRKSDCTLINGMYWPTAGFTPAQINSGKIITSLLRKEYRSIYGKGHSEVDPLNRRDPGPFFPIEEMRRLLV